MRKVLLVACLLFGTYAALFAQGETAPEVEKQPLRSATKIGTVNLSAVQEGWSPMLRTIKKIHAPLPSEGQRLLQEEKARANAAKAAAYQNGETTGIVSRAGDPNPPLLLNGFFANDNDNNYPNDNDLAISLGGTIVSVTNSRINVFNVNGTLLLNRSLSAFGSPPGVSASKFDPRAVYDPNNDRFIVAYLAGSDSSQSHIIVAFSQTNDPTGLWHIYALNGNLRPSGINVWTDYPQLALSNDELIITGNMFEQFVNSSGDDANRFRASGIWQIPLADAYAGNTLTFQTFILNGIFNMLPVQGVPDTYGPHMFFLEKNSGGNNAIRVYTLTGTIATGGTITTPASFNAPLFYGSPPDANQKNTPKLLETGDGRLASAYLKDRKIHFVMGCIAFNRPAVYYGRVNLTQAGLTFANISAQYIASDSLELGFPSITYAGVTGSTGEHASFVFFNTTAPDRFPGNAAVFIDSLDQVSAPKVLVEGQNFHSYGDDVLRWGDYSDIAMRVPREAWVAGYYVKPNRDRATWISQIFADLTVDPPPTAIEDLKPQNVSEVKVYPNPVVDMVSFDFEVAHGGMLRASIYDLQGKLLHVLIEDRVQPGTVRTGFNAQMLANGMYVLQVTGKDGEVYSKKFVVQH